MNKYFLMGISGISGMLIGIIVAVVSVNQSGIAILSYRLVELLQMGANFLIASIVAYYVKTSTDKVSSTKNCSISFLEGVEQSAQEIFDLGEGYMKKPSKVVERKILQKLKRLSVKLGCFSRYIEKNVPESKNNLAKIDRDFLAFKRVLTDSPWGGSKTYSQARISDFSDSFVEFVSTVSELRTRIVFEV